MTRDWHADERAGTPKKVHTRKSKSVLLSIVVPVYNEERNLAEIVRRILQTKLAQTTSIEIVIVDDGSTDQSWAEITTLSPEPRIKPLRHRFNQGKGAAIRTALAQVKGQYTVIQDADLEYDPNDFEPLLSKIQSEGCGAVFGSRYLHRKQHGSERGFRWLRCGVVLLNWSARLLYGVRTTDLCTCYKMISTSLLRRSQLESNGFEFCAEVTAKLARMNIPIAEVPIHYVPRTVNDGKKIRWHDGLRLFMSLWRYRSWQAPSLASDSRQPAPNQPIERPAKQSSQPAP